MQMGLRIVHLGAFQEIIKDTLILSLVLYSGSKSHVTITITLFMMDALLSAMWRLDGCAVEGQLPPEIHVLRFVVMVMIGLSMDVMMGIW